MKTFSASPALIKYLLTFVIIMSGLFNYRFNNMSLDRFFLAQWGFLIFAGGILGGMLLLRENLWMGLIAGVCSVGFLKTFLLQQYSEINLFRISLTGFAIFSIYYFTRKFLLKEHVLKIFLIPAIANIILIFIQAFDHKILPFVPVEGVTGFLGNASISAYYLIMTLPLFIKYFKPGIPFLILAILLTKSELAIMGGVIIGLIYLYNINKKLYRLFFLMTIVMILLVISSILNNPHSIIKESLMFRGALFLGVLDGIKYNPILGWGIGSFEPIFSMIKPNNSAYFLGKSFNTASAIVNHPHNEILYGWWNLGIMFPILFCGLTIFELKKFKKENLILFLILLSGFVMMMICFLSPPVWLLLMLTLGIYDNENENKEVKYA